MVSAEFYSAHSLTLTSQNANLVSANLLMFDETSLNIRSSLFKSIALVSIFFVSTAATLTTSVGLLVRERQNYIVRKLDLSTQSNTTLPTGIRIFASYKASSPQISGKVLGADARYETVRSYLSKYNSPLVSYSNLIVDAADDYGIDFRLITAIAQQESNLCKVIPPETYNCWGWGIHSRGTLGFGSYEEGIVTVTAGLRKEYIDKGFNTVDKIMSKYTPLSNGSWAYGVSSFMNDMR